MNKYKYYFCDFGMIKDFLIMIAKTKKKEKGSKLYFWEHKRKEAKTKHKIKPEKLLNDKYQFGEIITIFIINNFLIYIKKDYH